MNINPYVIVVFTLFYVLFSIYERYLLKELNRKISRTENLLNEGIAIYGAVICELDEKEDAIRLKEIRCHLRDLKFIRDELI